MIGNVELEEVFPPVVDSECSSSSSFIEGSRGACDTDVLFCKAAATLTTPGGGALTTGATFAFAASFADTGTEELVNPPTAD
jgi:hypothetical protein